MSICTYLAIRWQSGYVTIKSRRGILNFQEMSWFKTFSYSDLTTNIEKARRNLRHLWSRQLETIEISLLPLTAYCQKKEANIIVWSLGRQRYHTLMYINILLYRYKSVKKILSLKFYVAKDLCASLVLHKINEQNKQNWKYGDREHDKWTILMHPYVTTLFIVPFQFTKHTTVLEQSKIVMSSYHNRAIVP